MRHLHICDDPFALKGLLRWSLPPSPCLKDPFGLHYADMPSRYTWVWQEHGNRNADVPLAYHGRSYIPGVGPSLLLLFLTTISTTSSSSHSFASTLSYWKWTIVPSSIRFWVRVVSVLRSIIPNHDDVLVLWPAAGRPCPYSDSDLLHRPN